MIIVSRPPGLICPANARGPQSATVCRRHNAKCRSVVGAKYRSARQRFHRKVVGCLLETYGFIFPALAGSGNYEWLRPRFLHRLNVSKSSVERILIDAGHIEIARWFAGSMQIVNHQGNALKIVRSDEGRWKIDSRVEHHQGQRAAQLPKKRNV